jgi:hypothetical protein
VTPNFDERALPFMRKQLAEIADQRLAFTAHREAVISAAHNAAKAQREAVMVATKTLVASDPQYNEPWRDLEKKLTDAIWDASELHRAGRFDRRPKITARRTLKRYRLNYSLDGVKEAGIESPIISMN